MKAVNIFLNSPSGRARFALWFGFAFNLLYSVWGFLTGIFYRSVWFGAVAVYYVLLSTLKFFLIRTDNRYNRRQKSEKSRIKALRSYRNCGYLLGLLNLSMTGIVFLIIVTDKSADYSGIVLIVMGGYTFIRLIVSAVNITRLSHIDDPLLSASKCLGISVTLMSVFSLSTALFSKFCDNSTVRRFFNTVIGLSVSAIVISVAFFMIVRSNKKLKATNH